MEYTFYGIQENATHIFGVKTKEISKKERKNKRWLNMKTKKKNEETDEQIKQEK